jgi:hypothetical protein
MPRITHKETDMTQSRLTRRLSIPASVATVLSLLAATAGLIVIVKTLR